MIPPHEINNKEFSRVVRGYSIPEVDEYISYLKEQYTELYRENDGLQRRLSQAEAELGELKAEESDIRAALITAQKAGKKIITDANARAGRITMQTRIDCEKILEDFRRESAQERETLSVLKGQVANLKQRLFEMYSSHISMIEQITPNINEDIAKMSAITDDEYAASLAAEIRGKSGVDEIVPTSVGTDETVSDEELAALARVFGDLSAKTAITAAAENEDTSKEAETAQGAEALSPQTIFETEIEPSTEEAESSVTEEPQLPLAVDEAEELLSLLRRKAEEKQAVAEAQAEADTGADTQAIPQEDQESSQPQEPLPQPEEPSALQADEQVLDEEEECFVSPQTETKEEAENSSVTEAREIHEPAQPQISEPMPTPASDESESDRPAADEEDEDIFDTLRRLNEVFGAEEAGEDATAREFFDSLSDPGQKEGEDPTELSIEEQLRRAYPDHETE